MKSRALQLLLAPAFVFGGFMLYAQVIADFEEVVGLTAGGTFFWPAVITQAFVAAALVAGLSAPALERIYGKSGIYVAILMSIPVLYFQLPELIRPRRNFVTTLFLAYEIGTYLTLLLGGAWLMHNERQATERRVAASRVGSNPLSSSAE